MPNSGPNSGGTFANAALSGSVAWVNPSNAAASDDVYATATNINLFNSSQMLSVSGFGFAIPTGATINGIEITYEHKQSGAGVRLITVILLKGGSFVGSNLADATSWPSSDGTQTYGSDAELWGTAWTAEEINDSGFGVLLQARGLGVGPFSTASIDHVTATVHYTAAAAQVGFISFLGFMFGLLGSSQAVVGPAGPFRSVAGQAWTPGSVSGQGYIAGAIAGQGYTAGSDKGQAE